MEPPLDPPEDKQVCVCGKPLVRTCRGREVCGDPFCEAGANE